MVGDDFEADVVGANNCGIRAIWYNPRTAEKHESPMHQTIHDLRSLPQVLDSFWNPTDLVGEWFGRYSKSCKRILDQPSMAVDYEILRVEKLDDPMWEVFEGASITTTFNRPAVASGRTGVFRPSSADNDIAGGLIGEIHWGWFYINLLIVQGGIARARAMGTNS